MPRPNNHVTRALAAHREEVVERPFPEVSHELLTFLEALYPPRCYRAEETVEVHLLYAGAVGLIADMRASYQERVQALMDDEDRDQELASFETEIAPHMETATQVTKDLAGQQET